MKYHQRPKLPSSRNTTNLLFHLDHEHHVEMKHQKPRLPSSGNTTNLLFHLDHEHHVEMKHEISSKANTTQLKKHNQPFVSLRP